MTRSPFAQSINAIDFPTVEIALGTGQRLVLGRVTAVEPIDKEPLPLIAGDEDSEHASNTYAGNSVFWSGAILVLDVDGTTLDLPLKLAAGGADVLAAIGKPISDEDLALMVGACAVAVVGGGQEDATAGGARIVAVAIGADEPPVVFDNQFRTLVMNARSLHDLALAGTEVAP